MHDNGRCNISQALNLLLGILMLSIGYNFQENKNLSINFVFNHYICASLYFHT